MSDLSRSWQKFRVGDPLTDQELDEMIAQVQTALPYLRDRPGFELAETPALMDLETLRGFKINRQRRNQ